MLWFDNTPEGADAMVAMARCIKDGDFGLRFAVSLLAQGI